MQVSYRLPHSSFEEIRRAGEQTSPQVARAAGLTRKRDEGGGSDTGSSPIRRFASGGERRKGRGTVVRRFRGEGVQKVDGKGRVSIPAHFRRVLEAGDPSWTDGKAPELVVVYGDDRRDFLECFTIDAANDVDAKIDRLPRGSAKRRAMEKLFNGQSMPLTVDDTGRIVLPSRLRQKTGIDGEAYFIAMGDTFQIWKPETFDAQESEVEALLDELGGSDIWTLLGDEEEG